MNRTKLTIAILAATVMLTSCKRVYHCDCELRPDARPRQGVLLYHEVKAKDRGKAVQLCDNYDNEFKDCSLQ